jgi:hypothetical protein
MLCITFVEYKKHIISAATPAKENQSKLFSTELVLIAH